MIIVTPELRRAAPDLRIAVIRAQVRIQRPSSTELKAALTRAGSTVSPTENLADHPNVAAQRAVYRALGKDPSRYRGSAEALARRIQQGKGLYFVNNLVDINNTVSLLSMHSCGVYDATRIRGQMYFRVGQPTESYVGIGKEAINIEGLPVFCDDEGPYGSPTSDSQRAMITDTAIDIIMVIIDFARDAKLSHWGEVAEGLLVKHASANIVSTEIVE